MEFFARLHAKYWWFEPLLIFIMWRVIIEIVAQFFSARHPLVSSWPDSPFPPVWARWDSGWYYSIVKNGYSYGVNVRSNVNFFPLYPFLWKGVVMSLRIPIFWAGLLVSNACTLASFLIIYRWVQNISTTKLARNTVIALVMFPTSFFFISAYSESVLLFCTALTLFFSSKKSWILAALFAGMGSAARPVGIFLLPLVVLLWLRETSVRDRNYRKLFFIILLGSSGLAAFSLFLKYKFGTPIAWIHSQEAWGHKFVWPHELVYSYARNMVTRGEDWILHVVEVSAVGFIALHLRRMWQANPAYAIFALLMPLLLLVSNSFSSSQRYILVVIPLFFVVAHQSKKMWFFYSVVSVPLSVFAIYRFVTVQWVG